MGAPRQHRSAPRRSNRTSTGDPKPRSSRPFRGPASLCSPIRAYSIARDDGGALVPAPAPVPEVYLLAWDRVYGRLVKMLRLAHAKADELSVERHHLITEVQFLKSCLREREKIAQARLQQISKFEELHRRVLQAEAAVRLGSKELQNHCHQKLAEDDLEDLKRCNSNLASENTELKDKLKKFESEVEISTDNSDNQKSGKDIREEIRKLEKAQKILRSEKDNVIDPLFGRTYKRRPRQKDNVIDRLFGRTYKRRPRQPVGAVTDKERSVSSPAVVSGTTAPAVETDRGMEGGTEKGHGEAANQAKIWP